MEETELESKEDRRSEEDVWKKNAKQKKRFGKWNEKSPLTCDNAARDRSSLLVSINDRLDAVGVLHSWSQTGNVDTS